MNKKLSIVIIVCLSLLAVVLPVYLWNTPEYYTRHITNYLKYHPDRQTVSYTVDPMGFVTEIRVWYPYRTGILFLDCILIAIMLVTMYSTFRKEE